MSKEVGTHSQPEPIFVGNVSETVSKIQNKSPIISQQQIEPINLKYSPEVNLRSRSYFVFAIGLVIFIESMENGSVSSVTFCFFSFAIAFFMNASYCKGKSDWKLSIGQSHWTSTRGKRLAIVLGIVCSGIVITLIPYT